MLGSELGLELGLCDLLLFDIFVGLVFFDNFGLLLFDNIDIFFFPALLKIGSVAINFFFPDLLVRLDVALFLFTSTSEKSSDMLLNILGRDILSNVVDEISSVAATPASLNFRVIFPVVEELDENSDLPFIDVVMIFPFGKEPDEDSGPPFIDILVIIPVVKELDEDSGPPFVDVIVNFPGR